MCGLLRCQISAGCEELLVRNSWATCPCPESFWRLGIDLAGTWWSAWVKVEYVISCSAWMALRTSMLRVATSWCRVDTCVSSRSTDFRTTISGFSSRTSSCSSSSEMLSGIILLLLLMLMGLLLTLGLRDFEVFSLSAMRVWRLWGDNWKMEGQTRCRTLRWLMNSLLDELGVAGRARCRHAMDGRPGDAGVTWRWIIANSVFGLILVILADGRQGETVPIVLRLGVRLVSLSQVVRQVVLDVVSELLLILRIQPQNLD